MKHKLYDIVADYLDNMVGKTFILYVNEYTQDKLETSLQLNPYKLKEIIHRKLLSWNEDYDGELDFYTFRFDGDVLPGQHINNNKLESYALIFETLDDET